ncbi:MAG: hypothetical protein LBD23_14590 [Oscillospiraceae bacterium]|nr:hypothetical protein [Oscillospiraceae bacterium]
MQETNKTLQEITRRQEETDSQLDKLYKTVSTTDSQIDKLQKTVSTTDSQIDKLHKSVGSITNNFGSFAEEYFSNSVEKGQQNFFGKKFDEISKNLKLVWKNLTDEYDIVLYNNDAVAIIEIKFKAHENDVDTVLKKAETFKILSPNYKDFKIYLGLASMSFYPALEDKCIESGIAIIKQVGDTVVINDKHLKVF